MVSSLLHRSARRKSLAATLVATAVLVVSACGGESEPDPGETPAHDATQPSFEERARMTPGYDNASEEQLAILEDGEVTFEEYEAAVNRSLACMEDAGIAVQGPHKVDERGFTELRYSHSASSPGRTSDETLAVSDACLEEHSMVVERMYQSSPAAVEAQDAQFEQKRGALVQCLEDNDVDIDSDAPRGELTTAAVHLLVEDGTDCLTEADI